ncbi:MAG: VWA domain-containing protein [Thermoplasmata archaeon]
MARGEGRPVVGVVRTEHVQADGGGLSRRLVGFFGLLRARGVPVGLGEELDLGRALDHVNRLQRREFYLACRTTLVKRPEDFPAFERAFEEYWSRYGMSGASSMRRREPPARPPAPPPPDNVQEAWGTQRGRLRAGRDRVPWSIDRLRLLVYSPEAPPGSRDLEMPSRSEIDTMKRLARRFRRWAATLQGRRRVASRRGAVDFSRTVRASLRFGGEWLAVRRHRRKLQRTRLVVLWDVSGSMEGHGPLLLGIVYALLRAIPSAQLYAFSTGLWPLTAALRGRPYREAVRYVSEKLARAGGGTQIGRCLADFQRRYGSTVDGRTVVLILSDGWDVGGLDLLEDQMASLRRRAFLLLWMNPYAERPDFRAEVAGMRRALPHVDLLIPPTALARRDQYTRSFGRPVVALDTRPPRARVASSRVTGPEGDVRGAPTG